MIFEFIRRFIRDDEFEKTREELVNARNLLAEYKRQLEHQLEHEKEKVDPGFLTLIWASVGLGFATFGQAVEALTSLLPDRSTKFYVWVILAIFSLLFGVMNSVFALRLTEKYALSKSDPGYRAYVIWLLLGAALLVIGIMALGYLSQK